MSTVKEIIEELQAYPEDMEVRLHSDWSGEFHSVKTSKLTICNDVQKNGTYTIGYYNRKIQPNIQNIRDAVIIRFKERDE